MSRPMRSVITFLMGCSIFVLLPILGWGPTDIPGFLANPARAGFLILVCIMNLIVAIRVPEIGKKRPPGKTTVERQRWALPMLQVLSMAIVFFGPWCDARNIMLTGGGNVVRFIGLVLYAAGFWGMHIAELHLGRLFSVQVTIQEGHHLVTDGPYTHIRHPRYLSIMVFAIGLALVFLSWLGLALAVLLAGVLLWRIPDEEKMMRGEFAAEWDSYAGKTWRLIPFVY